MATPTHIISIRNGHASFVYSDDLAVLMTIGDATIRRASHVEPTANGQWTADMSPVNGPVLGPFALRGDALKAEVAWLRANVFGQR